MPGDHIIMTMTDTLALIRLQTWLSPVFPTGGFAYSHGLERAVHDTLVSDEKSLFCWLDALLCHGSAWNDAVLMKASWQQAMSEKALNEIAALGAAMSASEERRLETVAQGDAFLKAVGHWPLPAGFVPPSTAPLPVAVGSVCGAMEIAITPALTAYSQAFINNQLQAAIRLSVLGQEGAARLMARLEGIILRQVEAAAFSTLDDLGTCFIQADIVAMNHESQVTRLFRS